MSIAELVLIAVGGVLFTVGAVFLFTRWPDPFPRVFGYHEVWHVDGHRGRRLPLRRHHLGGERLTRSRGCRAASG